MPRFLLSTLNFLLEGLCLLRFRPEWAQGVDLREDLVAGFALSFNQLPLELPHLFLTVIAAVQFHSTFDHDGQASAWFGEFGSDTLHPALDSDKHERPTDEECGTTLRVVENQKSPVPRCVLPFTI